MTRLARLSVLGLLALALCSAAQERPPDLTPRQKDKLKERNRLLNEALDLRGMGQLDDALAAGEKTLALTREVYGDVHADVADTLGWLTGLCLLREDFPAARKYAREAVAVRTKLHGEAHWRVTDARLALADVDLWAGLTKQKRAELNKAEELVREGRRLDDRGEYARAEPLYLKALAVRKAVLGEKHPEYATSLNNLALLYKAQGQFAKAEPLYLKALAIMKAARGEKHPELSLIHI